MNVDATVSIAAALEEPELPKVVHQRADLRRGDSAHFSEKIS
jgi:hypothetical protein